MSNFKYHQISKTKKIRYICNTYKNTPFIVFLHGFMSDLDGKKPNAFLKFAKKNKLSFLALEYSGHGKSSGKFTKGNITKWSYETSILIKKYVKKNNFTIIGSSMGSWIALLVALKEKQDVHGIVGIASATDFTAGEWNRLSKQEKIEFEKKGSILFPDNEYGDYEVSYVFVNDGLDNLLLQNKIELDCPIRLLHGRLDSVVPVSVSEKMIEQIQSKDKSIKIIEDGEHSLSRDQDLEILYIQIQGLI